MAKELVETVYGKMSKFEIYKVPKPFGSADFVIYKNGSYWKGTFDSLAKAVDKARSEG